LGAQIPRILGVPEKLEMLDVLGKPEVLRELMLQTPLSYPEQINRYLYKEEALSFPNMAEHH
jgi:hypothetical protein